MDSLAKNITEKKLFENARVFIAPMRTQDVVTLEGSVLGGSNMLPRSLRETPFLASKLFDAGTKKHDKKNLRESLAARGASLSFSAGGDRTYFSGSCLPEDLPFLLQIVEECLSTAVFQPAEISSTRERLLGRLKEQRTDTRTQASNELSRLLYDETHLNYAEKDAFQEKSLKSVTRAQLVDFRSSLGREGLVLAIVGDIDTATALRAVERTFGRLAKGTQTSVLKKKNTKAPMMQEKRISIAEKTNIDIFLGCVVPLTYESPEYLPLSVLTHMLGGSFAAHLMQTVRERDGLTYGIQSYLSDFGKDLEGSFRIWATFSPDLYERGVQTIRKEVKNFLSAGLTENALTQKKEERTGSYVIGLSTTGGLASLLHKIGREGKPLSYLDEYPRLIRALVVKDIRAAAPMINLDRLSLAVAGTFTK
ncbi:insulinase family protein [Patescibacteria group bacterium]|nr:insulinase family protein [Patescibacteria group bacterium]